LNGPFWVKANRVALGYEGVSNNSGYKFLLGSGGLQQNQFSWRPDNIKWDYPVPENQALATISYHFSNAGRAYYCINGTGIQK
jgi:hypothetical protein